MSEIRKEKIVVKAFRFNKETDYLPYYKEYTMDVYNDDVMLDVLNRIKWDFDSTFTYRRSCRHGICGSCGIKVNNRATLACKERVFDMIELFGNYLVIEPQNKNRAIKDLVIDKGDFWKKYDSVLPYLVSEIDERPEIENIVSQEEYEELHEADVCVQCGSCYYACPAVEVNSEYTGPAALAKAYRFNFDVRDEAKNERLDIVNKLGSGIWDCVKCFECAEACPKGVNPIHKITALHTQTFSEGRGESNVATRHAVGFKHSIKMHGFLDEGMLVAYSEGLGVVKHTPDAIKMFMKGKIKLPWAMPKSKNLDEIKKLIESSSTAKF